MLHELRKLLIGYADEFSTNFENSYSNLMKRSMIRNMIPYRPLKIKFGLAYSLTLKIRATCSSESQMIF
jgi:hypothetical protein